MKKLYLATPYSHQEAHVRERRYQRVTVAAAMLINMGFAVVSPITHNHPIIETGKVPGSWAYWGKFDKLHLEQADLMVVLRLPGWDISVGVAEEIDIAKARGVPVYYLEEKTLEAWERTGCVPDVCEALSVI